MIKLKFFIKKPYHSRCFGSIRPEKWHIKGSNFDNFLNNTKIFKSIDLSRPSPYLFEKKPSNDEIFEFLKEISENIKKFKEKRDILNILKVLKYIKIRSKVMNLEQKAILFNYRLIILKNFNENLRDEFQKPIKYVMYNKNPDFYTNYLEDLSIVDRMIFIEFIRKIDSNIELHNTNVINKYVTEEFKKDVLLKKKRFSMIFPLCVLFLIFGNTLYVIFVIYYAIEYDMWLFDPRITDYHVYRFS